MHHVWGCLFRVQQTRLSENLRIRALYAHRDRAQCSLALLGMVVQGKINNRKGRIVRHGISTERVSLSLIQCSAECGSGVETRQVACADGSELFCNPKERPETERQCFGRESNCDSAKWFTGPWSFVSNR